MVLRTSFSLGRSELNVDQINLESRPELRNEACKRRVRSDRLVVGL